MFEHAASANWNADDAQLGQAPGPDEWAKEMEYTWRAARVSPMFANTRTPVTLPAADDLTRGRARIPRTDDASQEPVGEADSTSLRDLLTVTITVALLSSFGELAHLALRRTVFGAHPNLSPEIVWMAPVTITGLTLLATAPALAARLWTPSHVLPLVTGMAVLIGALGVLLDLKLFGFWACLLLAAGIAVQMALLVHRHKRQILPLIRKAAVASIMLVLALTVVVEGRLALRERRLEATLPAPGGPAPNVLLLILDTVRAASLGMYGHDRTTMPALEQWAATGVTFDRAIVPSTWTVPVHGSILTGQWPRDLDRWWTTRTAPYPTLPEVLGSRGYRTAAIIGNWYHLNRYSGIDHGFTHFKDYDRSFGQIVRSAALVRWTTSRRSIRSLFGMYETLGRKDAPQVNRELLHWLTAESDRPFFAFVNYLDAHSPYLPPEPYASMFGGRQGHEPVVIEELNVRSTIEPGRAEAERAAYEGGLAYLDSQIAYLLNTLRAQGVLDSTIVIITADHGEELGEHGSWGHAYSLHGEIVHVPLIMFGPGIPKGIRVPNPISVRNIASTIAEVAGVPDAPFPGISLTQWWRNGPKADTALSQFGRKLSLYDDRYHYLQQVVGKGERLYDHIADPLEQHDLTTTPEGQLTVARFRAELARMFPGGLPSDRGAPVQPVGSR